MHENLASAVALIHAVLIALILGGALIALTPRAVLRFPRWLVSVYLVSLGGTLVSYAVFGECLLTVWERDLRAAAGGGFEGTFLHRYLGVHPESFAPGLGAVLAVTLWAALQLRRLGRMDLRR